MATCSAYPLCQLGGVWAFQVGWCGLLYLYFIFVLFTLFIPYCAIAFYPILCYYHIVLLWFLSHCPAHVDISKLKWILLFSTYQCAALGILSEGARDSLHCRGGGCCWGFRSVALSFCRIWSCCVCAGSTTSIVNYYHTVLSLMSTLSLNRLGIVTLTMN